MGRRGVVLRTVVLHVIVDCYAGYVLCWISQRIGLTSPLYVSTYPYPLEVRTYFVSKVPSTPRYLRTVSPVRIIVRLSGCRAPVRASVCLSQLPMTKLDLSGSQETPRRAKNHVLINWINWINWSAWAGSWAGCWKGVFSPLKDVVYAECPWIREMKEKRDGGRERQRERRSGWFPSNVWRGFVLPRTGLAFL